MSTEASTKDAVAKCLEEDLLPNIAYAQRLVGEQQQFHPPAWAGPPGIKSWEYRQLAHLAAEVGELISHHRKSGELSLEEAADVFIVLSDLICATPERSWEWLGAIKAKTWFNLRRAPRFGWAAEETDE